MDALHFPLLFDEDFRAKVGLIPLCQNCVENTHFCRLGRSERGESLRLNFLLLNLVY